MPGQTNAAICRERGWQVGDIVEARDETSAARFRITGIGEALVLVRQVGFCNFGWGWTRNEHDREMVAGFGFTEARKVEQNKRSSDNVDQADDDDEDDQVNEDDRPRCGCAYCFCSDSVEYPGETCASCRHGAHQG